MGTPALSRRRALGEINGNRQIVLNPSSAPKPHLNLNGKRSLEIQDPKLSGVIATTNDSSTGARKKARDVNGLALVNEDTSSAMVEETSLKWSPAAQ